MDEAATKTPVLVVAPVPVVTVLAPAFWKKRDRKSFQKGAEAQKESLAATLAAQASKIKELEDQLARYNGINLD